MLVFVIAFMVWVQIISILIIINNVPEQCVTIFY